MMVLSSLIHLRVVKLPGKCLELMKMLTITTVNYREVKAEFEKLTSKPIVGIILTHFHADHTNGTSEFIEGREDEIEIFAHDTLPHYLVQVMDVRSPITYKRAVKQFGMEIPADAMKNAGIGLNLRQLTVPFLETNFNNVFAD